MLRAVWNHDLNIWEETATLEEIAEQKLKDDMEFYMEELEYTSYAVSELACKQITEEEFEEVRLYIDAINPMKFTETLIEVIEPKVFLRYKNKKEDLI
ncbi:MAG: hypothetical protein ACRC6U_08080 [Fusobacteriaceae bacterium]